MKQYEDDNNGKETTSSRIEMKHNVNKKNYGKTINKYEENQRSMQFYALQFIGWLTTAHWRECNWATAVPIHEKNPNQTYFFFLFVFIFI